MNPQEIDAFLGKAAASFEGVRKAITPPPESDSVGREDWRVRVQLWRATLADVEADDAERCLQAIHRGDAGQELRYPSDWSDRFPSTVRQWCRNHTLPKPSAAAKWGEPERFRCPHCRDRGAVLTVNPGYIANHRMLFEDQPAKVDPRDKATMDELRATYNEAKQWCRRHNAGPLTASTVCDCDSPVAQAQRHRITEHRNGCVFNKALMPVLTSQGPIGLWQACVEFVSGYTATESYEQAHAWQP